FSGEILTSGIDHILYTYNLERLPGWSSVRNHLQSTTPDSGKNRIDELVKAFGLAECMQSRFARLSLGQQNRTNLVRYLLQDFDLLIMDESLANVDEVTKEKIILTMKTIFPDRCFLYISHSVTEVAKFCRQILVLRGQHRNPQTVSLLDQDYTDGKALIKKDLEQTMLEIVNAA
ncbi:MAG: ATP-binding cassette domain-containing protein, partial [Deltaproteobacteria bacterium]|nr:ATP-binding cassette domain-containing protein [Deltaproteobacteria bacterium]